MNTFRFINMRFKLVVVNQHPEGEPGGDHWEVPPTPWDYHSLDSPGVKKDNSRGGILENSSRMANNVYATYIRLY